VLEPVTLAYKRASLPTERDSLDMLGLRSLCSSKGIASRPKAVLISIDLMKAYIIMIYQKHNLKNLKTIHIQLEMRLTSN